MSYEIRRAEGRFRIAFQGEGEGLLALEMAPGAREPFLDKGTWLILLFGVWSVPDRDAIDLLVKFAKSKCTTLNVGVRPFDDFRETLEWCEEADYTFASPVWLLLREGRLVAQRVGLLSEDGLREFVDFSH